MSTLTAALYGALVVYLGGWFLGFWTGNFALLLFILTVVTLGLLAGRALPLQAQRARRPPRSSKQQARHAPRRTGASRASSKVDGDIAQARDKLLMQPWWLDWTAGLFPVILIVFLLRSFLFEPFKIPSGSMIPTLLVGDLILVNKFHYGVRLPVINKKILANNDPQRGDVMVFRYPPDTRARLHQARRRRAGRRGRLPEQEADHQRQARPEAPQGRELRRRQHALLAAVHRETRPTWSTASRSTRAASSTTSRETRFPFIDSCRYSAEGVICKVPPGHYFMMGDNRDNSQDSRYWGFVPDENIVGKAFFVWMNFGNLGRIGSFN